MRIMTYMDNRSSQMDTLRLYQIATTDATWLNYEQFSDWVVEEAKRTGAWQRFDDMRDFELMMMGM